MSVAVITDGVLFVMNVLKIMEMVTINISGQEKVRVLIQINVENLSIMMQKNLLFTENAIVMRVKEIMGHLFVEP